MRLILVVAIASLFFTTFALTNTRSAGTEESPVAVQTDTHFVRQVPIITRDVVFEPNSRKLYASVPSSAGANGNSIARINPVTGQVEGFVFIGSEPGKLALSDDGTKLYVSLDGAGAVRSFDIATQTAGAQFSVGESSNGPLFVKDMAVAPGNPNLVAVSRKNLFVSPDFEGVAIFDGGVRRPLSTPGHTGSDFIDFSDSASVLYGLGGGGLQKISVGAAGLTAVSTNLSTGGGEFKFKAGHIYHPFGQVFNAEAATLAGTFTFPFQGTAEVEPDLTVGRVYFLTGTSAFSDTDSRTLTLRAFDRNTFLQLGTLEIPNVRGPISRLIRWGANGLAFGSTGGQFYIIQTSFVPSSEPVPTPTPTPSPTVSPSPTPTPTPAPGQLRELSLNAKDIVIDPTTETIFASVPSSAGSGGNSITPFDPVSGTIALPIPVGSEPNKLAISDNGQLIYVGLDGAKAVRRFDVATRTPGLQFSVGSDQQGQLVPVDIEVQPGQPQTVAVIRGTNPNDSHSVALYDDGVQRAVTTSAFPNTGSSHRVDVIEFSGSPQILYGHNSSNSEFGFRKMAAASCGLTILNVGKGLLSGAADFRIENGLAYATNGRVANPETGTLVGMFPVTADLEVGSFPTAVLVDSNTSRIYFFRVRNGGPPSNQTMLVRAYDLRTFLHVGTLAVPNIFGSPINVVRWGTDGFAIRTSADKVYLLQTSLISTQPQPFTPAPSPTPPLVTISGQVSAPVGRVLPPITLHLSGGQSGTTTTGSDNRFTFTGLPLCTDFTITPVPFENYTFSPSSLTLTPASLNNPNQVSPFFFANPKLVSFTSTSVNVGEGNGSAKVSVTRTGDLSAPLTVKYQTNDGTASERSDYGTAIGTLRFEPNENTKQITVFLVDDVRDEQTENLTISLSDPSGAFLGTNTVMTLNIGDNDASNGTTNPADIAQFFVRQHYVDFLNREPDAPGLAFWSNEITSCGADVQCIEVKRINVSAAFYLSIEFQETGYLAYRTYKAAYGDTTSPNVAGTVPIVRFKEFLADQKRIGEGVQVGIGNWEQQLEENKNAYALEFVQRLRFMTAFPVTMTADEFVTKLDQHSGGVLGPSEKSQLVALLGTTPNDTVKRATVLRTVADDSDLRATELNRAFVLMQYYGYLRRNPDDPQDTDFGGWKFWLDKLNQFTGNFVNAEMVKAFILSGEYRQRFGP